MTAFLGYQNKRVLVSGCFSGMGEATAKLLLELGAEVHGLDYKETRLSLASFTKVDLREPAAIDAAVARIKEKTGVRVDALFNCAGLAQTSPPIEVMKVNYAGTGRLTDKVLPLMGPGGALASIASTADLGWSMRIPMLMELARIDSFESIVKWCEAKLDTVGDPYSFAKEALIVWTMSTSTSLIKRGIRINCTLPGPTETPTMKEFEAVASASIIEAATRPINRRSRPEEQAAPLVFLNSDAASYMNGLALPVDGGFLGGIATGQIDPRSISGSAQ